MTRQKHEHHFFISIRFTFHLMIHKIDSLKRRFRSFIRLILITETCRLKTAFKASNPVKA